MPIRVVCARCQKGIKAPDHYAGRKARCPGCGAEITIPLQGELVATDPPPPPPPRREPPREPVAPPPPPPQQIIVVQQPAPEPPRRGKREAVEVVHRSRGSFLSGCGLMSGCLTALALFTVVGVGGCLFMAMKGVEAVDQTIQEVDRAIEEAEAEYEVKAQARREQELEEAKSIEVVRSQLVPPGEFQFGNHIDLEIRNNSDKVLTQFAFECVLKSPGRAIPWGKDNFTFEIPGGLNPGESREVSLRVVLTSDLANVEIPDDAELETTITRVDWYGEAESP